MSYDGEVPLEDWCISHGTLVATCWRLHDPERHNDYLKAQAYRETIKKENEMNDYGYEENAKRSSEQLGTSAILESTMNRANSIHEAITRLQEKLEYVVRDENGAGSPSATNPVGVEVLGSYSRLENNLLNLSNDLNRARERLDDLNNRLDFS